MNYNSKQIVQAICIVHVVYSIKQPELHWKSYTVEKFYVSSNVFLVFETLQVKCKYVWQFFNFHPG